MKNYIIIIIFFLAVIKNYSQSGTVIYKGTIKIENVTKKIDSLKKTETKIPKGFIEIITNTTAIDYTLQFHNHISNFKKEKVLERKSNTLNLTSVVGGKGIFYCNLKKNLILNEKEAFGEKFIVSQKIDSIKWTLETNTKKIGKYLCYKATTTEKINTKKGTIIKDVTAWYTTKLPYRFGPINYCNLPGLILELKIGKFTYTATEITLNVPTPRLKTDFKGEKVTLQEFKNIGLQAMEGLKNR